MSPLTLSYGILQWQSNLCLEVGLQNIVVRKQGVGRFVWLTVKVGILQCSTRFFQLHFLCLCYSVVSVFICLSYTHLLYSYQKRAIGGVLNILEMND
jgi:hypothetical protein